MNKKKANKNFYDIDKDKNKDKIIKDLLNQVPYLQIKKKYPESKLTVNKLKRYAEKKICYEISKTMIEERTLTTQVLIDMMKSLMQSTSKMLRACEEELEDSDRPGYFDLSPHACELMCRYKHWDSKSVKKKNLQELLNLVSNELGVDIISIQSKAADPRELLLKSVVVLQKNLEFLAKITGQMQDIAVSIDVTGVVIPTLVQIIVRDTADYPELQEILISDIEKVITDVRAN